MLELNIVTPVSRPYFLPYIEQDFIKHFKEIRPTWYCIFDVGFRVAPLPIKPINVGCWESNIRPNGYGGGARNIALDKIKEGWIFFLDDDNTIHPDFESVFLGALKDYPDGEWFVFEQVLPDGRTYLKATDKPRIGRIDMGQCVVKRQAIGNLRMAIDRYDADGYFYEALAKTVKPIAIPKPAVFYNALRYDTFIARHT